MFQLYYYWTISLLSGYQGTISCLPQQQVRLVISALTLSVLIQYCISSWRFIGQCLLRFGAILRLQLTMHIINVTV